MREILFRGFYKDPKESGKIFLNGEWVNGKWVYGGTWKNARGQRFITEDDGCSGFSVIPETVGQFTGIVDAIGNKIFDGDIIWDGDWECDGEVQWSGDYLSWMVSTDDDIVWLQEFYSSASKKADSSKVIGNRWDNPELLEGK